MAAEDSGYNTVHDGTSQSARFWPELKPDYVLVDERSIEDLLAFFRAYARELKYFGNDNIFKAGALNLDVINFMPGHR